MQRTIEFKGDVDVVLLILDGRSKNIESKININSGRLDHRTAIDIYLGVIYRW
jgi:hypothetical protein